jgi:hypothetical protein
LCIRPRSHLLACCVCCIWFHRRRKQPGGGGGGGEEGKSQAHLFVCVCALSHRLLLNDAGAPRRVVTGAGDVMDQQREKTLTMDDLYGEGKPYPEPYNAGTVLSRCCAKITLTNH